METTSKNRRITDREIYYFRQRQKNLIFQSVIAFFAQQAERYGLTKSAVADSLGKDRSQITRWLSGPGNWELDSISDFLLGMGAEMRHEIVSLNEPEIRTANVTTIHESEELAYMQGLRAVWVRLLEQACRELGIKDPAAAGARWISERERTVSALRTICADHGDNDWPDNLHLADVIEKHLGRHL